MSLIEAVADRVQALLERGSGRPIMVAISLEPDAIHGQVSDEDEPGDGNGSVFEINFSGLEREPLG